MGIPINSALSNNDNTSSGGGTPSTSSGGGTPSTSSGGDGKFTTSNDGGSKSTTSSGNNDNKLIYISSKKGKKVEKAYSIKFWLFWFFICALLIGCTYYYVYKKKSSQEPKSNYASVTKNKRQQQQRKKQKDSGLYSSGGGTPSISSGGGTPSISSGGGTPSTSSGGSTPSTSSGGGTSSTSSGGGTPSTSSGGGTSSTSSGGGTPSDEIYAQVLSDGNSLIINNFYVSGDLTFNQVLFDIDQEKLEYQKKLFKDTNFMNLLGSSPQVFIKTMDQMVKQLAGSDAYLLLNGTIYNDNYDKTTWEDLTDVIFQIEKNANDQNGKIVFHKENVTDVYEDVTYLIDDFLYDKYVQESKQNKKYTEMLENEDFTCNCLLVGYNPPIDLMKGIPMPDDCIETVKTIKNDIGELNFYHHFLVIATKKISATNIELTIKVVSDLFEYLRHVVKQIIQDLNFEFRESLNTKLNLDDEEKKLFDTLNVALQQRSKEYVEEKRSSSSRGEVE